MHEQRPSYLKEMYELRECFFAIWSEFALDLNDMSFSLQSRHYGTHKIPGRF